MLKKIVAVLLFATIMCGVFAGCSAFDNHDYITNGEFYALFIEKTNIYTEEYHEDNLDDYEAAEYVLYDYYLLDDKQINAYDHSATKEIVAQVCVRYMEFRQAGSVDIKDIDKCYDQQAIIDAVEMEILSTENGYFDAEQKVTAADCQKAIDKMLNIELNSHYTEGVLEIEYKNGVVVLDENIEIIEHGVVGETATVAPTSSDSTAKITAMGFNHSNADAQIAEMSNDDEEIWFGITRAQYDALKTKPSVGKVMVKPYFSDTFAQPGTTISARGFDLCEPTAIKVTQIKEDSFAVRIYGKVATAEEYLEDSDNEQAINKKNTSKGATIKENTDSSVPEGIKIDTKSKPGYVKVTFGHTFTITDKIYGKQTWRNPSASPSMSITAEIGNFKLDTKNIGKLILGRKAEANVKLTYDTYFNTTLKAGGLRYSPANNGNGGLKYSPENGFTGDFFANVKNARFTGASAGGSKPIKLAQIAIPLGGGFYIKADLNLSITLDGTISFTVDSTNCAELKVKKTKSGYNASFSLISDKEKSVDVNANLQIKFILSPNISFLKLNIIDAEGIAGGTIDAMASIYASDVKESSAKFYATQMELDEQCNTGEFQYCIGSSFEFYLEYQFLTTKSKIGKFVINELKLKTPSAKFVVYSCSSHFEDGHYVDKCTRDTDVLEKNSDGEIKLMAYKFVLDKGEQIAVEVESIPLSHEKMEKNGGVSVSTGNKKVATAMYNEATNTIVINAIGAGSTEISIKIPIKKDGNTYYEQKISVTVLETSSDIWNTAKDKKGKASIVGPNVITT